MRWNIVAPWKVAENAIMAAATGEERFICRSRWWKCTENENFMNAPRLSSVLEWNIWRALGRCDERKWSFFALFAGQRRNFSQKSVSAIKSTRHAKVPSSAEILFKSKWKAKFKFWNILLAFATFLPFSCIIHYFWEVFTKGAQKVYSFIVSLLQAFIRHHYEPPPQLRWIWL